MKEKIDYSKYQCPYSYIEKECGHELHGPQGYEGAYGIWCACGFRGPAFCLEPGDLMLREKSEAKDSSEKKAVKKRVVGGMADGLAYVITEVLDSFPASRNAKKPMVGEVIHFNVRALNVQEPFMLGELTLFISRIDAEGNINNWVGYYKTDTQLECVLDHLRYKLAVEWAKERVAKIKFDADLQIKELARDYGLICT
jgi:hypothetical protein